MKLTYGMAKATLARVANLNEVDSRLIDLTNEAQERLLYEGMWKDTVSRYVVCVTDGCLTWPREIETIEAVTMCDTPTVIRNQWYEFLESGPGALSPNSGPYLTLADRGNAVAFDDITVTGTKLAVYADGSEAAGETILVRYYTSLGQKMRTVFNGETIEGERIAIPTAGNYSYSTNEVLPFGLYEVIKPITNYPIRLYQYTLADATLKPLAYYEPDETMPDYRRSLIPCLNGTSNGTGECSSTQVIVMGKRRYIPIVNDDSVLIIPHIGALKMAIQAIRKEENNLPNEALDYWYGKRDPVTKEREGGAVGLLDKQLKHHQGNGTVVPMRFVNADGRGEGVLNII